MDRIVTVVLFFFVVGCCDRRSESIRLDTSFVGASDKPSFRDWELHQNELIYLVSKGHQGAIRYALKVLPIVLRSDQVTDVDILAMRLYDHVDVNDLGALGVNDQITLILAYDRLMPVDWEDCREEFLKIHPETSRVYRSR